MRWRTIVAGAALLACGSCASGASSPVAPATTAPVTAAASPTGLSVGQGPVGLAADQQGTVWIALAGASKVARIRSGATDLDIGGVDTPLRLVVDGDSVWVTAFGTGELVRLSASSGSVVGRVPVGKGAEGVAAGLGAVWVVAQDAGQLVRIDPTSSTVAATIPIGIGARLVTTGLGSVWVSHFTNGTVLRVDPATSKATTSERLCAGPQGIATTARAVWVACTSDNVLVEVDPSTMAAVARIPMPTAPDGVAVGPDGRLRVVAQEGPRLVTVDPASASVTATEVLGQQPQLYDQANLDVVATSDAVWVSSFGQNSVLRATPR